MRARCGQGLAHSRGPIRALHDRWLCSVTAFQDDTHCTYMYGATHCHMINIIRITVLSTSKDSTVRRIQR